MWSKQVAPGFDATFQEFINQNPTVQHIIDNNGCDNMNQLVIVNHTQNLFELMLPPHNDDDNNNNNDNLSSCLLNFFQQTTTSTDNNQHTREQQS